jgi:hypothetical protein
VRVNNVHVCGVILLLTDNMLLTLRYLVICLGLFAVGAVGFAFSPEWEQYRHYRDYVLPTFAPQCNLTDYYRDIHSCTFSNRRIMCEKIVLVRYHRKNCVIWTPMFSHDNNSTAYHPLPDCQYTFELTGSFREVDTVDQGHNLDVFLFRVTQYQCVFQFSSAHSGIQHRLQGGSSFDIFAYTAHAMARCRTIDHFNDTYTIRCSAPAAVRSERACINLSILLEHEHYDTFSLVLQMWTVSYSSVRRTLIDNTSFCTDTGLPVRVRPRVQPSDIAVNGINYFSGNWIWRPLRHKLGITFCTEHNSSFLEFSRRRVGTSLEYSIWNSFRGCYQDVVEYKWADIYEIPDDGTPQIARSEDVSQEFEFKAFFSSSVDLHPTSETSRALNLPTHDAMSRLVAENEQMFILCGASHMRYTTFGLLDMLYGSETIRSMSRNESIVRHEHFHFEFHPYAHQMTSFVKSVCANISLSTASVTLVLQTGDWDLTSGPSKLTDDPSSGPALLQVIRGILDGANPCYPVHHVVFLTAMPYPICYSDSEARCAEHRCFRTNPAIAATNHYLMEHLLNMTVAASKRFSIVDAFDIGVPRVALNQNFEVACRNHFLCAVGGHNDTGTEMVYAPTGLAVVQTLLQALTFDDAGKYS